MQTIEFYVKSVYGMDMVYFSDPKIAEAIWEIAGKRTLTPRIKRGLELLGYKFAEVIAPRKDAAHV